MRKIKNKYANKRKGILTINTQNTQTNQTKTKLSLQGPQWSRHSVAPQKNKFQFHQLRVRLASFFFIFGSLESPPSILVTRNPNWSQRSGTGTGCVKEGISTPNTPYLR